MSPNVSPDESTKSDKKEQFQTADDNKQVEQIATSLALVESNVKDHNVDESPNNQLYKKLSFKRYYR